MKDKIMTRFFLVFIAVTLLSFIATSFFSSRLTYQYSLKTHTDKLYEEASFLATTYGEYYYSRKMTAEDYMDILIPVASSLNCHAMLINADGQIIAENTRSLIARTIEFDPTDAGTSNRFLDDFYGLYSTDQLTVFYPITYYYQTRGYIVLSMPLSAVSDEADSVFNYNYITMLFTLIFALGMYLVFTLDLVRPIKKITTHTANYAKGNFTGKINLGRSDELGQLADSLDYMGSEISSFNDYQRKFIANVSHDFRSPLTSIKGYLEAMLDGTIPPEMQGKYLEIVISETERLTKLTNNLLVINNVNANGMVLDISDFDVCDTIKRTIETFEGVCAKKKIKFKLVFSEKSLFITADFSKIQQVLYNLIDNAIKFSNNDSSIIISATDKNDKVIISIKDFGIGIPRESLNMIWDRFYKTDLSRGKDKKGTGLGLAIVKDIITAHNEYIDVVSTEGVGTEFSFALPRMKKETGIR